jgi:hypothetical protein
VKTWFDNTQPIRLDKTLAITDFKCGVYTPGQETLFPLYEAQANSYGFIANHLGYRELGALALVYTEPTSRILSVDAPRLLTPTGFYMPFSVRIVSVENRAEQLIPSLLRRAPKILNGPTPAAHPDCKDCSLLTELIEVINNPGLGKPY